MRRERRTAAFTLLEVMAAVLVLGMLYTVLANAAMQGLAAEGATRRRFQASLIADRALAGIETDLALGVIPDSGSQEEDADPYLVSLTVQPFDPSALIPPDFEEPETRSDAPVGETLLTPPSSADPGRLRRIDVRVTWQETGGERSVVRTTFAFDTEGLEALFPSEEGEEQAANEEEAEEEDDENGGSDDDPIDKLTPEDMRKLVDTPREPGEQ